MLVQVVLSRDTATDSDFVTVFTSEWREVPEKIKIIARDCGMAVDRLSIKMFNAQDDFIPLNGFFRNFSAKSCHFFTITDICEGKFIIFESISFNLLIKFILLLETRLSALLASPDGPD